MIDMVGILWALGGFGEPSHYFQKGTGICEVFAVTRGQFVP